MLVKEASKQGEIRGESVTVSDVIRACILEKYPPGFGCGEKGKHDADRGQRER